LPNRRPEGITIVSLAEDYDYVVGGGPDRDTIDLAVVDTSTGGVRAHVADNADGPGYQRLLTWARQQAPGRRLWALEGTGSFAAGLVAALADAGEEVAEVPGGKRTRGAKNDHLDAIRAARTALASDRQIQPRAAGLREAFAPGSGHPRGGARQPDQGDQRAQEPYRRRA
jgi:transposase